MDPTNYLLPFAEMDWASALAEWRWTLPSKCTSTHITCFGDLFLASGSEIYLLDLECGTVDYRQSLHTEIE